MGVVIGETFFYQGRRHQHVLAGPVFWPSNLIKWAARIAIVSYSNAQLLAFSGYYCTYNSKHLKIGGKYYNKVDAYNESASIMGHPYQQM